MPYYVYRIEAGPTAMLKTLDLQDEFAAFKDAKELARKRRMEQAADAGVEYKVIFAETRLEAEERLQEVREQPILREWEK
jgi:hypothetical protein